VASRKRPLIILAIAAIVPVLVVVVLRRSPAPKPAPVVPPPQPAAVEQPPVVQPPPSDPPPPPPVVEQPPPPPPDPAQLEAEQRAKARADALAAFERGLAAQRQKSFDTAAKEYQTALRLDAELAGAWTNLGLVTLRQNSSQAHADVALQYAQKALTLDAMKDPKRLAHAQSVVGHIAEAAGKPDVARAAYQAALKANPAHEASAIALSGMQSAANQPDAAIATLASAYKAGATGAPLNVNLAVLYLQAKQPAAAAEQAQVALRASPDLREANLVLGYAQLALQRWGDAAQNLDEAARADPRNADLQVALGFAYEKLGRRQDALAAFDRALALKADHVEALSNRAVTLDRLGQAEAAHEAYARAVAARSGDGGGPKVAEPDPTGMAAQLQLAVIAARKQQWEEARRLATPVVAAQPANAQARYVLGLACFYLHDLKCASEQEYQLGLVDVPRAEALRKLLGKH
jgi:tetratricopeptide (TPR) repeat protein